jgi:hypothetical protein
MKYGCTTHVSQEHPRKARRTRRSKVMLAKHEQGWTGFLFWMTMACVSVGIMIVVVNNI